MLAGLYALLSLVLFAVTFATAREHVAPSEEARPTLGDLLRLLRGNSAFLLLFAATMVSAIGGTLFSKSLVYYVIYALGSPGAVGLLLATLIGTITLAVPLWQIVTRRTSKRFVWLCGSAWSALVWSLWFLLPPTGTTPALLYMVASGVGSAAFYLTFWSMLPDTVEYGLFKTRVRAESLQFGLLGILLDSIGYRANQPQSAATLGGLTLILTVVPAMLAALSGLIMYFYPIDERLHHRLTRAIRWRSARAAIRSS
jgi:GPH family glycoside/pentoside/hexuronide:cation symporter